MRSSFFDPPEQAPDGGTPLSVPPAPPEPAPPRRGQDSSGGGDPWAGGTPGVPIYEETAPPAAGYYPQVRKERGTPRGTAIFCILIALIAAGVIAILVFNGVDARLTLPELPEVPVDPGYEFSFPSLGDAPKETTIQRYAPGGAVTVTLADLPEGAELSYQEIYEKVLPSIVGVRAYSGLSGATGTGVVLSGDGYIVTNFHVIEGAERAQVVLQEGSVYEALLVGGDRTNDLAVLKIEETGLTAAEFGSSDTLRVGDEALAIGNPLGEELQGTMTNGIISAINREVNSDGVTMTLIQTTAALNSGNSGGALVNICGQVVGITNMKMSAQGFYTATVEGLGFAIPSITVKTVVDELIARGYVAGRPTLGITVQALPEETWGDYDLPEDFSGGLLVVKVDRRGGAYGAGVREGDIIVSANGVSVPTTQALADVKNALEVGDVLRLRLWRKGEWVSADVTLIAQHELDNVKD